jgi:hypothetical protein
VAGHDVVEGQVPGLAATILTTVVVAAQNLSFAEPDARARSMDHIDEANDRGTLIRAGDGPDDPSAVLQYCCLTCQDQPHRSFGVTYVEGFVIPVEY